MAYHDGSRSWAYSVREHRVSASLVGLAAILMLLATLLPRNTASAATTAPPAVLFPANGAYFGAWVAPRGGESAQQAIQRVESQVDRTFAIDHQYYRWDTPFPTAEQSWTVSQGRIPFVNWKPQRSNGSTVSWSNIASGAEDAAIIARADAIKAFGYPMYLSFHHEPEDDLATFGTPADYAAAFRHVVTVFQARGVTNVAFVWTMMSWSFNPNSGKNIDSYYPGDTYVDAIGSDGYCWYPGRAGDKWVSFQTVFQPTQNFAVSHGKPWMAVEYGAQEDPATTGRKGQWLIDALATIKTWPALKALIYFDELKLYPWQTDSSASSMAAYTQIGASSYLRPATGSNPPPPPAPSPVPSPSPAPAPSPSPAPAPSPAPSPVPSPSPVPAPSPTPSPLPAPVGGLSNTLNNGLIGLSLAAVGGGTNESPFDTVIATAGASVTYDTTHTRGIGLSAKHVVSPRQDAYYEWDRSFGTQTDWNGRVYVWFDNLPSGDLRLVRARGNNALRFAIDIMKNGQLRVKDSSNFTIATLRTPIVTGSWVRIEWGVNHASGQVEVRLFNSPNLTSATDSIASGTGRSIGSATDTVQIGRSGSQPFSATFWTDDPAIGTKGFIGPVMT